MLRTLISAGAIALLCCGQAAAEPQAFVVLLCLNGARDAAERAAKLPVCERIASQFTADDIAIMRSNPGDPRITEKFLGSFRKDRPPNE